ncbi:MAG TPA: YbaK/EbsC family protein [Firmicutes bacterium]|jgi:prolyl-tRNA editing enzyme YbaK/EbsC (Cys-tRNA(Pro) deacylase)|nr:YbaK/EbsC family protein [Bacillota bacterium]
MDTKTALPKDAQRIQDVLRELGSSAEVLEFPEGTRTVVEAAASIGVEEGQIAKSLVFMCGEEAVLVVASGRYRVDMNKLSAVLGKPVRQAKPAEVKEKTCFPIGGVSPVGHKQPIRVLLETRLWDYPVVYAAAGTPNTAFATTGEELLVLTKGERVDVAEVK